MRGAYKGAVFTSERSILMLWSRKGFVHRVLPKRSWARALQMEKSWGERKKFRVKSVRLRVGIVC